MSGRSEGEEILAWELTAAKIPFERQVQVTATRKWTFDFVLGPRFAVEVEGGAYSGGHKRGAAADTDAEKFNHCALAGWKVLRFTTSMVNDGRAMEVIKQALGLGKGGRMDPITEADLPLTLVPGTYWFAVPGADPYQLHVPLEMVAETLDPAPAKAD
jgi:very-short-patch-repair endonuclease